MPSKYNTNTALLVMLQFYLHAIESICLQAFVNKTGNMVLGKLVQYVKKM